MVPLATAANPLGFFLLVTGPEFLVILLFENEIKNHRSGETPKGKSALVAERLVEILQEGFDSKKCLSAA